MVKNQNYIQIQGWMINELNLSGNDLLCYALIYGFSQDGESEFKGSLKYVQDWLNSSRPTAIKSLKSLEEKGLIIKRQKEINNVKFNRYKVDFKAINFLGGSKESLPGGSKESLPNNNSINNTNIDREINTHTHLKNNYPQRFEIDFERKYLSKFKQKNISLKDFFQAFDDKIQIELDTGKIAWTANSLFARLNSFAMNYLKNENKSNKINEVLPYGEEF